ncbi:hypothetical protein SAMN04488498_1205 [Mesorhizobium albiziae]|uniref:Uncharacterized protein n=1 Tax=Neomesorhizobium albiziae TaxID=335020 RepID=A0A1I4DUA5_9HYPH|nr:hypothetical protein [Mesorhizobium albiziae]GLS32788.1 hypothetical protein GCM10007937_44980 [Mesorhizobium albiziae]SFK97144.1 hypothetical protein SAMN04488498_1205 [Mesorhizobium albiziae]
MPEALSDEQWEAMRGLAEGMAPTHGRAAAAGGIYQTTLCGAPERKAGVRLTFAVRRYAPPTTP